MAAPLANPTVAPSHDAPQAPPTIPSVATSAQPKTGDWLRITSPAIEPAPKPMSDPTAARVARNGSRCTSGCRVSSPRWSRAPRQSTSPADRRRSARPWCPSAARSQTASTPDAQSAERRGSPAWPPGQGRLGNATYGHATGHAGHRWSAPVRECYSGLRFFPLVSRWVCRCWWNSRPCFGHEQAAVGMAERPARQDLVRPRTRVNHDRSAVKGACHIGEDP
jgi:hypothetical protein